MTVGFQYALAQWKKTYFPILFIELDRLRYKEKAAFDTAKASVSIESLYDRVNQELENTSGDEDL